MRNGADFPTIWHTILKGRSDVSGLPIQGVDEAGKTFVEIPLITGQSLIIHHDNKTARLR
jgi:hypothetical protein